MNKEELISLLEQMSLEEKIGQLLQLTGSYMVENAVLTGPEQEMGVTKEDIRYAGSILSTCGAKTLIEIQKKQMKHQPHHIPMLFMLDVIHGFRTIFPVPLALGATFDPLLIKQAMRASAKETSVSGVHITFSPMSDLCRDPRWGRVMESTGEDKYLNQKMTEAFVEGYQGENLSDPYSIGACIKHFAAYSLPEGGREYNNVELSKRSLFEDYLPAYEAGIKSGACMVMTSFNTLERIPCTANSYLLQDILRGKMEFDGVVISDYGAVQELISHGVASDAASSAKLALTAGVDIEMMSNCYGSSLKELVSTGQITMEQINQSVLRILELKNKLGLFEHPYKDASEQEEKTVILCKEHKELAKKVAEESFVLLENDGILPLKEKGQKIAVIGPFVDRTDLYGVWALTAKKEDGNSIKDVIATMYEQNEYTFATGCDILPEYELYEAFGTKAEQRLTKRQQQIKLKEALNLAKNADVVILTLGEHRLQTGEAAAVANIALSNTQLTLLKQISCVNSNVVVLLFNGRPLELLEVKKRARAVLEVWYPGTCGAEAIVDTLFGKAEPSGRLPMSVPYCAAQVPVYYDTFATGRPKESENTTNKFCSRYEDIPNGPLYPFGYGLSYGSISYGKLHLSKDRITGKEDQIIASVDVTNQSDREVKEAVQLYIRDRYGSVVRPVKELKGVQKIVLLPKEKTTVFFTIKEQMLRFYTIDMTYQSEPGEFQVFVGHDSQVTEYTTFFLA